MKSKSLIWTYLFSLAAGLLLIIFSGSGSIFRSIVVALGFLFLVPSVVALIMSIWPPKNENGVRELKWYIIFTASLGVAFGVILLAIPSFFVHWIVYTLAVILIFCGITGIIFMRAGDLPEADWYLYALPVLTLVCGLVILFVGPNATERVIALIAGIFLTIFSVNGFWGYFQRMHRGKKVAKQLEVFEEPKEEEVKSDSQNESEESDSSEDVN